MNLSKSIISMALSIFLLSACGKKEVKTYSIDHSVISAEAPLIEGSNTVQGEIKNDIRNFAKSNGFTIDDLEGIRLKSVVIRCEDSLNFDNVSSLMLQMVTEKSDMIELGVINPIEKGKKEIKLSIAGDQKNILELMKEDKITMVADANMIKDSNTPIRWECQLEFDLSYKK